MAIVPTRRTGFLQQTSERRTQRNISNFRLRTGQKFPDIARGRLFEQDLATEQIEKQQQARIGLQFRQQEESERQARVREQEAEQARVTARRARKREEPSGFEKGLKIAATVAAAFT